MDNVRVNITIKDAHLEQMDQVTADLKTAGLEVEQTLSTLGIITGTVASEKLSSLSEVEGVDAVEADRSINLPPPGSGVQ